MILNESYGQFAQRLAAFYYITLAPMPEQLSVEGISNSAFEDLHSFFSDFYKMLYDQPEVLNLPNIADKYLEQDQHKSKNQAYKKAEGAVKPFIIDFINLLYNAGQKGRMNGQKLIADIQIYEKYLSKQKRNKKKFFEGVAMLGLELAVDKDKFTLYNNKYPQMLQAMTVFSHRCAENKHYYGRFCFFMCDLGALDHNYEPLAETLLDRLISCSAAYKFILDLHKYMIQNAYTVSCKFESEMAWEIFYTNKKIKSSPLIGISFDIRYKEPVTVTMRFVSTSRLTQIIGSMPNELQESFYHDTGYCRGSVCGWCKNQKGLLRPSVLNVDNKQKTICWYAQKRYTNIGDMELNNIMQYIKLHEQLIS